MSLDTEKVHRLRDKGFNKLYSDHSTKWEQMVREAVGYVKTYLGQRHSDDRILIGDIVSIVCNAIKVDPDFESYVKNKKLQQKYWVLWFSEYVLEKVYPQQKIK